MQSTDSRPTAQELRDRLMAVLTPIQLAIALSMLRPADEYTAAATAGLQVAWLRWDRAVAMADASRAVAAALPTGWADDYVPHDELQRRRYPPDGDRFAWSRGDGVA